VGQSVYRGEVGGAPHNLYPNGRYSQLHAEQADDGYVEDDETLEPGMGAADNRHTYTSFSARFNRYSNDIQDEQKSEKNRFVAVAVILAVSLALILLLFTGTTGSPPPVNDNSEPTPSPDPSPDGPMDPALDALRPQVSTNIHIIYVCNGYVSRWDEMR
jgi:hypothetical protein